MICEARKYDINYNNPLSDGKGFFELFYIRFSLFFSFLLLHLGIEVRQIVLL